MDNEKPKRAFTIELIAHGDTFEEANALASEMAEHLADHGESCDMVMGGSSRGGFIRIVKRPEMTHDRYHEELRIYLEKQRAMREESPTPSNGSEGK